jgi:hypothetical protein
MKAQARNLLSALTLLACLPAAAQEAPDREPWLFVGPRLGVSWAMTSASRFDQELDDVYGGGRDYFPVYSQLGFSLAQHLRLRPTAARLLIQEGVLLAGLDQNYALPSVNLRVGVHLPLGLEAAVGPELVIPPNAALQLSLLYAVGWRFSLKGVSVPVLLVLNPLPRDRLARLTLLSGIDFELLPKKRKTPFNY